MDGMALVGQRLEEWGDEHLRVVEGVRDELFCSGMGITRERRAELQAEWRAALDRLVRRERDLTTGIPGLTRFQRRRARKLFQELIAGYRRLMARNIALLATFPFNDKVEDMVMAEIGDLLDFGEV